MKKILVFGASAAKQSINKKLAAFVADNLKEYTPQIIDLNDFEMPIYSTDKEQTIGIPEKAKTFSNLITESAGVVVSLAEHNASYTAAFKNILDWSSRIHAGKLWQQKPMFVLSTAPGERGALTVLTTAINHWSYMDGKISAHFSLPFFKKNFKEGIGITDETLRKTFYEALNAFKKTI